MTATERMAEKGGIGIRDHVPLIREKQIRAVKIGQWRVKPKDLEDFIKSRFNMKE